MTYSQMWFYAPIFDMYKRNGGRETPGVDGSYIKLIKSRLMDFYISITKDIFVAKMVSD